MPSSDPGDQMSIGQFLADATHTLRAHDIPTARLDVLVLMEDVLRVDRARLLAHPEQIIAQSDLTELQKMVQRRTTHEPLAYIRNKSEFYGREFYIDHHVLEPRPESETMIDLLKALPIQQESTIIDVGTGSGALAITANLEFSVTKTIGLDIDPECLNVASHNNHALDATVELLESNLLMALDPKALHGATLLCNLPYVPDDFQINPAAMREPRLAIFGGPDGLDIYRKLFLQITISTYKPAFVFTEALPPQHLALKDIAERAGFLLDHTEDFIQVFRTGSERLAAE